MIQPSFPTAVLPQKPPESFREGCEKTEGLEPIALSSIVRERLRVLNQALESSPASSDTQKTPTQSQRPILQTINE